MHDTHFPALEAICVIVSPFVANPDLPELPWDLMYVSILEDPEFDIANPSRYRAVDTGTSIWRHESFGDLAVISPHCLTAHFVHLTV